MSSTPSLEERVDIIEARNVRVAADKAWETSLVRKLAISLLTYVVIGIYLTLIRKEQPWVNALVPVLGYLLSTLVLAEVKATWIKRAFHSRQK